MAKPRVVLQMDAFCDISQKAIEAESKTVNVKQAVKRIFQSDGSDIEKLRSDVDLVLSEHLILVENVFCADRTWDLQKAFTNIPIGQRLKNRRRLV